MPNVINLLTEDHRRVEELFGEFAESGDEATARTICDELTLHTEIEETLVYPVMREVDEEMTEEAIREHAQAKQLIQQIRTASGDELVDLMEELEAAIEHHVGEEEGEAFPKLEEQLGEERLEELGENAAEYQRTHRAA
jgi:hemerythrin superfamily protein